MHINFDLSNVCWKLQWGTVQVRKWQKTEIENRKECLKHRWTVTKAQTEKNINAIEKKSKQSIGMCAINITHIVKIQLKW